MLKSMKSDHQILHQKFKQYGANAKEWTRKCILLLPDIEKYRIWEQKGFGSIYEYAAKLAECLAGWLIEMNVFVSGDTRFGGV